MSEPFDVEKVSRYTESDICDIVRPRDITYVRAEDYDQLLDMHRRQKAALAKAVATIEAIERECLIGCRSLPSVRNAIDCERENG